jgi:DNA-binding winged helix-turn-helix (wHTH) protein
MEVELIEWPSDGDRLERVRGEGRPRLLLVGGALAPPSPLDDLEDWIRVPAPPGDLRARTDALSRRASKLTETRPSLDSDGVLRVGDRWVSLPPVEHRLTQAMLDRFGAVVGRESLTKAGWPDGAPRRNALDVHVLRLRRRVAPVGLAIRTVRSRGYLLEVVVATPNGSNGSNGSSGSAGGT